MVPKRVVVVKGILGDEAVFAVASSRESALKWVQQNYKGEGKFKLVESGDGWRIEHDGSVAHRLAEVDYQA